MTSITDKINISAAAIRASYRENHQRAMVLCEELGVDLLEKSFDLIAADKTWAGMSLTHKNKICGLFYSEATERQAKRVLNKAVRGFRL